MTYNVFGGTLNLAQSINLYLCLSVSVCVCVYDYAVETRTVSLL